MNYFDTEQYIKNYFEELGNLSPNGALLHFRRYGQFEGKTDQKDKKKYLITVVTPCIRPSNLLKIKDSLNFDFVCEWIIVYDSSKVQVKLEDGTMLKQFEGIDKISEYYYELPGGCSGNVQRNYALSLIKNKESFIYYLDDDNIIHPDLYKLTLLPNKIYTFNQLYKNDKKRLTGNNITIGRIDSAMFLVWYPLVKDIKWEIDKYDADGYYILECYSKNKDKLIYINKYISYYNYL